ncbi:hypothetical protein PTNB73_05116 [Pyrenophora teres f. teres]|nr:hypothetical protein PTNB29_04195 [Pyrenophora teres f. teres]KAE8867022.1 hypothetical protein PTNB73_05116 [Pyrenophora teres f. teres]
MIPANLANAITLVLNTAAIGSQPPPPPPARLLSSVTTFAASLKASFPNPGLALLPQPYWWWQSGTAVDALLVYGETTGDRQYENMIKDTILSQATPTSDFMTVDATGNDDQSWWALAALTAAENSLPQSGPMPWQNLSQNVLNDQKKRWTDSPGRCKGGMRWKIVEASDEVGYKYKSAITNGLFFQLAARLGALNNDTDSLDWAEKSYNWSTSVGLVDKDFNVYDGTDEKNGCADLNHNQWSYNVGVFLYGSAVMASYTKDSVWVDRTRGFIASANRTFTDPKTGALFESKCEGQTDPANACNSDQVSFKGILARYLGATAKILPEVQEDVEEIMHRAANAGQIDATQRTSKPTTVIDTFNKLEVAGASLRLQGVSGSDGMIGVGRKGKLRRSSSSSGGGA